MTWSRNRNHATEPETSSAGAGKKSLSRLTGEGRWRQARTLLLFLIIISGGATALHLSLQLHDSTAGITRYNRIDTWAVQQTEYDVEQFRGLLARHVAGDPDAAMADVLAQLAKARSTVSLMKRGAAYEKFRYFVDIDGVAKRAATALGEVDDILREGPSLKNNVPALQRIEKRLSDSAIQLRQLAIDVSHIRIELQDGDSRNAQWLIRLNRWMLIGYFAATVAFIIFLWRETVIARRAEATAVENEKKALYIAEHDTLTDLPNRMHFGKSIAALVSDAARGNFEIGLHILDLDGFKDVNDSFGHESGDALLLAVGQRLETLLREGEILARLDGDEFAIVETPCRDGIRTKGALAQSVLDALSNPFDLIEREIHLGASIGSAYFPEDGEDATELLKAAGIAMHVAKEQGQVAVAFRNDMRENLARRKTLEFELRKALSEGGLKLFYQPQIDLLENRCIGAEALIRWNHPELGWISPGEFIPVAESTGLVLPLGRWVMETACREAQQWHGEAADGVVAVNVSPQQFIYEDIVEQVKAVLDKTGLPARRLELEITEGMLMRDEQAAIDILNRLRSLGVQLAIDDFGTGYSSLSYLRQFEVHKLKIDQSFVKDMQSNKGDEMIVHTIIELGKGLGMKTIAEGIEEPSHVAVLLANECDEGQGYYFGKPMPLDEFCTFLSRREEEVSSLAQSVDDVRYG